MWQFSGIERAYKTSELSRVQFKERDELARIFKQWQHLPSAALSVSKVWDGRVRQHLGTRYDARRGCFDWDLTMKLHSKGVSKLLPYTVATVLYMNRRYLTLLFQCPFSSAVWSHTQAALQQVEGERRGLRAQGGTLPCPKSESTLHTCLQSRKSPHTAWCVSPI